MKYITFNTTKGTKLTPSNLDKWASTKVSTGPTYDAKRGDSCAILALSSHLRMYHLTLSMGSIVYYYYMRTLITMIIQQT